MIKTLFYEGDASGSTFFRIPFLWTTEQGNVIAGVDANFGSTGDSGENIDVVMRLKNAGEGIEGEAEMAWQDAFIPDALHMKDYADEPGYKQKSASFIDAVIFENRIHSKRLFIHIDAWCWNGGLFSYMDTSPQKQHTMRNVALGDGFAWIEGKKYLLLSSQNIKTDANGLTRNINANTDRTRFDFCADVDPDRLEEYGGRYPVYHLIGQPENGGAEVSDAHLRLGERSSYELNRDFELWKDGKPLTVRQQSARSNENLPLVAMKVFYENSELQLYNTSYILQLVSDDEGRSWQTDRLLNPMVKHLSSRAYITGPGRGAQIEHGPYRGRLLAPVYFQEGGRMFTEVIYSDDGGKTWQAGSPVETAAQTSEAAPVALTDGTIKLFMRNTANTGGSIVLATSHDGGQSWTDIRAALGDEEAVGVNCQLTALALKGSHRHNDHNYQIILLASAKSRARKNGCLFVGRVPLTGESAKVTPQRIEWFDEIEITAPDVLYGYSCLTELADGRAGLLYESSPTDSWEDGLRQIYYREFDLDYIER